MDRGVLIAALVVASVIITVGMFAVVHEYAVPMFANGGVVAHRIDTEAGDLIAARFPGLPVGAARCPPIVNLTNHRHGRCAIPIGTDELRIDVSVSVSQPKLELEHVDALFVRTDAERTIVDDLAGQFGERFDVRCAGPAIRVVPPDTPVVCSIEAPDVLRRGIEVTPIGFDGQLRFEPLLGVTTRAARAFGPAAERREGWVEIAGRALERYLTAGAALQARGEVGRRGLVRGAKCPVRVVLYEGTHVTCTVRVADLSEDYDVHFEKGLGLRTDFDKTVVVMPALEAVAARYFERSWYTAGQPLRAKIDCISATVAFVEPGSSVPCTAVVRGKTIYFAFKITDAAGDFTIAAPGAR